MYRILAIGKNEKYFMILDATDNSISEFSLHELYILSEYVYIAGYRTQSVAVRNVMYHWPQYQLTSIVGVRYRIDCSPRMLDKYIEEGYLLCGTVPVCNCSSDFLPLDVGLLMRSGIRAVISDTKKLLYLDSSVKDRVVLSDFCNYLCAYCMRRSSSVLVFDDNIRGCEEEWYANARPSVDISRLHDTKLKIQLNYECNRYSRIKILNR